MPEGITPESLFNNIMETLHDNVPKQKSVSFFEEDKSSSVSSQFNRLFGRQEPVHHILGGGKSADVLLWRNKKISASVLAGATAIWVLFEWLNYNFLPLACFALVLILVAQFAWSTFFSRSKVPRLVLPNELFVQIATSVGAEVNRSLKYLQDIACRGNIKQLVGFVCVKLMKEIQGPLTCCSSRDNKCLRHELKGVKLDSIIARSVKLETSISENGYFTTASQPESFIESLPSLGPGPEVVGGLLAAAMIGSCCNFLTVLYIGFVAAHTLPVLYERYDDQVDNFVYNLLGQLQHHYGKLDARVLSRIPKGKNRWKKFE